MNFVGQAKNPEWKKPLSKVDKTRQYLCIGFKKNTAMSKELRNWIESIAEVEALVEDLELEPAE